MSAKSMNENQPQGRGTREGRPLPAPGGRGAWEDGGTAAGTAGPGGGWQAVPLVSVCFRYASLGAEGVASLETTAGADKERKKMPNRSLIGTEDKGSLVGHGAYPICTPLQPSHEK